ncbi:MAG: 16S rRNA (guanine(966)-N(2))-methyltransferase RsmD [Peptostreptococcaceae bacterium]|nr:16S rRNA (guanine(966)-N(2))-methyltransferase RsmD [Peptostreptococcaceae bacterium]
MRVISGTARGKKLKSPVDESVRPTLDRVKENLFNIIGSGIRDAVVLDLFAGSGALGIEALSRGAKRCVFVDNDKRSIELVRQNLKETRLAEHAVVHLAEAQSIIQKLCAEGQKFDYIFIDPPYCQGIVQKILKQLEKCNIMQEEGFVIIETDRFERPPEEISDLLKIKEREYSNTRISIFRRRNGAQDEQE